MTKITQKDKDSVIHRKTAYMKYLREYEEKNKPTTRFKIEPYAEALALIDYFLKKCQNAIRRHFTNLSAEKIMEVKSLVNAFHQNHDFDITVKSPENVKSIYTDIKNWISNDSSKDIDSFRKFVNIAVSNYKYGPTESALRQYIDESSSENSLKLAQAENVVVDKEIVASGSRKKPRLEPEKSNVSPAIPSTPKI